MKKIIFFLLFLLSLINLNAQLDYATGFLHYKRSIQSNFINGEFQIGNIDEGHFLTITPGFNFSSFAATELSPYFVGNVITDYGYGFTKYSSKKKGMNAALGYCHYFKSLGNEEELIPWIGLEFSWIRIHDSYKLHYFSEIISDEKTVERDYNFHTLTSNIQSGIVYVKNDFFFKAALIIEFFLPVNNEVYMASDPYNAYGGFKLPVCGLEPSLQIGIGYKLY
jgi:hypothetical protein